MLQVGIEWLTILELLFLRNDNLILRNTVVSTVSVSRLNRADPFVILYYPVDKETKEKIKYDDYKLLSEEEKKGYNVYPKLQVYNVFNVAQTNLQEARPDLYKKLADAGDRKSVV